MFGARGLEFRVWGLGLWALGFTVWVGNLGFRFYCGLQRTLWAQEGLAQ